jgi:hypothetical protein
MNFINIQTLQQVRYCIELYADQNDYEFLPIDFEFAIANLSLAIRRKKFVRALEIDNKIVAWIYADAGGSLHFRHSVLQQQYYCSVLKGHAAYRAIRILHDAMLEYAEKNKYQFVFSVGSHLDEHYIFTRILEKLGWERRGHISLKKTSHYNMPVTSPKLIAN